MARRETEPESEAEQQQKARGRSRRTNGEEDLEEQGLSLSRPATGWVGSRPGPSNGGAGLEGGVDGWTGAGGGIEGGRAGGFRDLGPSHHADV